MVVEELVALLGFEMRGEQNLRRFNKGLAVAERRANEMARTIGRWGAAVGAAVGAAGAALSVSVIKTSASFEQFEATLETIEGSAEKARSSMDWIAKFGATTPYQIDGVTAAFIKLRSYGIDPMDGTLRTLGDASSAMGKTLDQSVEALADAATGQFERLKEFGIVASTAGDEVTFSWTKNGETLTRTVRKQGDEIRKFVLENLGDRFNGAMIRQSKTFNGLMSNLADSWTAFQLKIGRAGIFETVRDRLAGFMDYLNRLADNGTLDRWAERISGVMEGAFNEISRVAGNIGVLASRIASGMGDLSEAFQNLKIPGLLIFARLFPVTAALLALGWAIDDITTHFAGGESMFGDFLDWLSALTGVDADKLGAVLGTVAKHAVTLAGVAAGVALFASSVSALARALGLLMLFRGGATVLGKAVTAAKGASAAGAAAGAGAGAAAAGKGASAAGAYARPNAGLAAAGLIGAFNLFRELPEFIEPATPESIVKAMEKQEGRRNEAREFNEGLREALKWPDWLTLDHWRQQSPSGRVQGAHGQAPASVISPEIARSLAGLEEKLGLVTGQGSTERLVTEITRDHRNQSVTVHSNVTQHITESRAPAEAGKATDRAVTNAATKQSRVAMDPAR